jgi:hypothetical protein
VGRNDTSVPSVRRADAKTGPHLQVRTLPTNNHLFHCAGGVALLCQRQPQGALVVLHGAVLVCVSFTGFFAMVRSMVPVAGGTMSVMSSLLMVTALVMFGRFSVMFCGMSMMLGGMLMVLSCFRRHVNVSSLVV